MPWYAHSEFLQFKTKCAYIHHVHVDGFLHFVQ